MPTRRLAHSWKFQKDEIDAWVKAGGAKESKKKDV